jgi:hypothetical protein
MRKTGRDLRYDLSMTKAFAESSTLKKAYLLTCADPSLKPVPTQMSEVPSMGSILTIPFGQKRPYAAVVMTQNRNRTNITFVAKNGQTFNWDNQRVQEAIENAGLNDQRDFVDNVLKHLRDPNAFTPSRVLGTGPDKGPGAGPDTSIDTEQDKDLLI